MTQWGTCFCLQWSFNKLDPLTSSISWFNHYIHYSSGTSTSGKVEIYCVKKSAHMSLKKEFFHQNLYFTFTYSIRNRHKIDDLLGTTTLPPKNSYCSYVDAFVIFLTPKCAIFSIYLFSIFFLFCCNEVMKKECTCTFQ